MSLSDILTPRMQELGKIKLGGKGAERPTRSGGTFRLPEKWDHIVITGQARNARGDLMPNEPLMAELLEKYGEQRECDKECRLRQLPIYVLSDDLDDVLLVAYVWYGGKTCGGRSDGKTVTWYNDPKTGKRLDEPRVEPWQPEMLDYTDSKGRKLFKTHCKFYCVIRTDQASWGGAYVFRSTSQISATNLYSGLLQIKQLTNGVLRGIPLWLQVREVTVTPEGKPIQVYVLQVVTRGPDLKEIMERSLVAMRTMLENKAEMERTQAEYRRLLLPPGEEGEKDQADINEEFSPETMDYDPAPSPIDPLLQDEQDDEPLEAQYPEEPATEEVETVDPPAGDTENADENHTDKLPDWPPTGDDGLFGEEPDPDKDGRD